MSTASRWSLATILIASSLCLVPPGSASAAPIAPTLDRLGPTTTYAGFRAISVYLDDSDRPMGGRFVHEKTGFVLDLLDIQSVPQAFVWVNTLPTSDQGEPHTQEHLLLGKGDMGRAVATQEPMSLARSSAYTEQWRTCYHFYTNAGPEVFYQQFEQRMEALLHPDYTDEEIRREVRNFGVSENPSDKTLRLEEKGTVYNEMVGATADPIFVVYHALGIALYGPDHPLAYVSGGSPEGIRVMKPEDIRSFHDRHYVLDNMGMVASVPKEVPLGQFLERAGAILDRLNPSAAAAPRTGRTRPEFPPAHGAPAGTIAMADFPEQNPEKSGSIVLAWAPVRSLDAQTQTMLELFLKTFAGDATTNLYKRFVDTQTRVLDVGAKSVSHYVNSDPGTPVYISLDDVSSSHLNTKDGAEVRRIVLEELARIAAFKDGSPELKEFDGRVRSQLVESRRAAMKFVNSPPGFGFRGASSDWMWHLVLLEQSKSFRRSLTLKPEFAAIERQLSGSANPWRKALADWKLMDTPYVAVTHPSPEMLDRLEHERASRNTAEVTRLRAFYHATSDQQAIRRYKASYDSATAALEAAARASAAPKLVDALPRGLDDPLDGVTTKLAAGTPCFRATFDNMTSATTGMAFRLNGVQEEQVYLLALLPALLTEVGVVEDGRHVPYDTMKDRLRNEILSLSAQFSVNDRADRYELAVYGAGNSVAESEKAVAWMRAVMLHSDWSTTNLPRIRDVVDQSLGELRNRRQGYEETWVSGVGDSYRRQDSPLFLITSSFLTQTHAALRLRWQLMDGAPADRAAASAFLSHLAHPGNLKRQDFTALVGALQGTADGQAKETSPTVSSLVTEFHSLSPTTKTIAVEAAKDLAQELPELPEGSLTVDWAYLCGQMRRDLLVTPEHALAGLESVRGDVFRSGNARVFVVGSKVSLDRLTAPIQSTLAAMPQAPSIAVAYSNRPLVRNRLTERLPAGKTATFVGLLNPNSQGGVVMNSAPFVHFTNTDDESVQRYLAGNLYGGGGAHGVFMKTWAAGLAYNNGIGANLETGRQSYYADKTPEVPQTLRFVIDQLAHVKPDPSLGEYAVSLAFGSRAAAPYESRAESMAANLADGLTPEIVSAFRRAVLDARRRPGLVDALYQRMPKVYARVLPGFGDKVSTIPGGNYFIIGPEKQFTAYEAYLKSVEGPQTQLFRLYPRDFWMPATDVSAAPGAQTETTAQ